MSDDENVGSVIQRAPLPAASGMDAIEARLVIVQEVPSKAEVRFFAIRGESRERLTTPEATAVLREHVPQKHISELSEVELLVEVDVLRKETARMRPVYEAAKAWGAHRDAWPGDVTADAPLIAAVGVAVIAEKETS